MSENRRNKRANERNAKSEKMKKEVLIGSAKVTLTEKEVKIAYPFKRISYNVGTREYANYMMLFDGDDEAKNRAYGEVLLGLEMIPSFGHSDAALVEKIMSVVIDDFSEKLNSQEARGEDEKELLREAEDLLDLQIQDVLNNGEK